MFTVNVLKFLNPFSFCPQIKMLVFRAGIHKILVKIVKSLIRLLLQKQSDLDLHCLSRFFGRQHVFEILEHLP